MVKETKFEDTNSVADLINKIWQIVDLFRHEAIEPVNYHLILFFLSLQKDDILERLNNIKPENLKADFRDEIENLNNYSSEVYKSLLHFYNPVINSINLRSFHYIIQSLSSLNKSLLKENFAMVFDHFLYKLSKSQGRFAGEYIMPFELSHFICGLANLPKNAKVYNPFAGVASLGVLFDKQNDYLGQEINQAAWAIGSLRIMAYERDSASRLILGDSIKDWNPARKYKSEKAEDILKYGSEKVQYDLIIANPPFGMRLPQNIIGRFGNIRTCEHFVIEKGIEDLKATGKLIVVIPNGFLFRLGSERNIRQYLIKNDLIEMIISFPGGLLMHTRIPLAVLVINKDKKEKGMVRFIEAKNFVETLSSREKKLNENELNSILRSSEESPFLKIVSNETIKDFAFDLSGPRYFQKQVEGVKFSELVNVIRGQRNADGFEGKLVGIKDLKDDKLDYLLDTKVLSEGKSIRIQSTMISKSCLLLASSGKSLKPTYFHYTGESILIAPEIYALKVDDTKVDLNYLINELSSDYVSEQLEALRFGSIFPVIRKIDLLNIKIHLPSFEEQKAKVSGTLETLFEEKKKELLFFKKIHGLESEIVEHNTYLRHTLAGPTSNLKGSFSNIKKIISDKIQPKFPEIMTLKVSENHELTFSQYLDIMERDVAKITDAVSRQLKAKTDISSKELSPIHIISFLKSYVSEYSDREKLNFTISFDFDKETFLDNKGAIINTFIYGNSELLSDLFDNLINNAVKHAFTIKGKHRIEIYLMGALDDNIQILVSNTGKPFPENFTLSDYIRKGAKTGINSGDGFGGWYINEIIKKMNGSFDIIDETGPEGLTDSDSATSFEINFPIIELLKIDDIV